MYKSHNKYTVAFNRDRDFYEMPLALAEVDKLHCLVTDLYLSQWWAKTRLAKTLGLSHRTCKGITPKNVKQSIKSLWLQILYMKFARSPASKAKIFHSIDSALSVIAGQEALRSGAGLFLYSGYALEAFRMVKNSTEKLLFVYHPQGEYVQKILKRDFEEHPEVFVSHQAHISEILINEGERVKEEILLADRIVCASNFTRDSTNHILGIGEKRVDVVPYGCYIPKEVGCDAFVVKQKRPTLLFVGQGTQRKGLHHLIKVWSKGLYLVANLTIVVNKLDPGITKLIKLQPKGIRILTDLSANDLSREYRLADIFVMPSLVEGFGLVYLEAMAAGCYVVGTSNTGLPDLNAPDNVGCVIPAGDLDALHERLILLIQRSANGNIDRQFIRQFATTKSWLSFREGIRCFIDNA